MTRYHQAIAVKYWICRNIGYQMIRYHQTYVVKWERDERKHLLLSFYSTAQEIGVSFVLYELSSFLQQTNKFNNQTYSAIKVPRKHDNVFELKSTLQMYVTFKCTVNRTFDRANPDYGNTRCQFCLRVHRTQFWTNQHY